MGLKTGFLIVLLILSGCTQFLPIKDRHDNGLIIEIRDSKVPNYDKGVNCQHWAILNTNDRKVLAQVQTHCIDEAGNDNVEEQETSYIEAQSEVGSSVLGHGYWESCCPKGTTDVKVSAKIID